MRPIYLDNQATTPMDPRVPEAMLPYFTEHFGNAASRTHEWGWRAEAALEKAREQVAKAVKATPTEVTFTGSATESNNLALMGYALANAGRGMHLLTTQTEHASVLEVMRSLEGRGFQVTYLPVNGYGQLDPGVFEAAVRPDTILASVIFANNEIGTINRLGEIGKICKKHEICLHTDAVQAFGKLPIDVQALGIHMMSWNAHKIYGPKGIGALYLRRKDPRITLEPILFGGGHERGVRPGTANIPAIVGFGRAAQIAVSEMAADNERLHQMRERLWNYLSQTLHPVKLNGHPIDRLAHNLNITFCGVHGEALITSLQHIGVSTGSACASALMLPSHVLLAIGKTAEEIQSSVRISFGRFNTLEEVDIVAQKMSERVHQLREIGRNYDSAH